MGELTPFQKTSLQKKLDSTWFNAARTDILADHDDSEVLGLGEKIVTDLLRVDPQSPFVHEMIDASPNLANKIANLVDGRNHNPEDIFRICGEAAIISNTVVIEL